MQLPDIQYNKNKVDFCHKQTQLVEMKVELCASIELIPLLHFMAPYYYKRHQYCKCETCELSKILYYHI